MKSKFLRGLLAVVMTASLTPAAAIPAFADDGDDEGDTSITFTDVKAGKFNRDATGDEVYRDITPIGSAITADTDGVYNITYSNTIPFDRIQNSYVIPITFTSTSDINGGIRNDSSDRVGDVLSQAGEDLSGPTYNMVAFAPISPADIDQDATDTTLTYNVIEVEEPLMTIKITVAKGIPFDLRNTVGCKDIHDGGYAIGQPQAITTNTKLEESDTTAACTELIGSYSTLAQAAGANNAGGYVNVVCPEGSSVASSPAFSSAVNQTIDIGNGILEPSSASGNFITVQANTLTIIGAIMGGSKINVAGGSIVYKGKTYGPGIYAVSADRNSLVNAATSAVNVSTGSSANRTSSNVASSSPYYSTASSIASSVSISGTDTLAAAASIIASNYSGTAYTTALTNAQTAYNSYMRTLTSYNSGYRGGATLNTIVVAPYLDVNFAADCSNAGNNGAYYTLNITPRYNVYAADSTYLSSIYAVVTSSTSVINASTGAGVPAGTVNQPVTVHGILLDSGALNVNALTTLTVSAPKPFLEAATATTTNSTVYVTHMVDDGMVPCSSIYRGGSTSGNVTFTTSGFSPFKFTKVSPTAGKPFTGSGSSAVYYDSLEDAANAVPTGSTIYIQSNSNEGITVKSPKTITIAPAAGVTPRPQYTGVVKNANGATFSPTVDSKTGAKTYVITDAKPGNANNKVMDMSGEAWYNTMANLVTSSGFAKGSCSSIVVASADRYQDALSASGFAGLLEAPIVLTEGSSLTAAAQLLISQYAAPSATVYVVGGAQSISDTVLAQISSIRGIYAERVWGLTATTTAEALYNKGSQLGYWGNSAILASSNVYEDALCAAPYAYKNKTPIFLTTASNGIDSVTANAVWSSAERIIVGGPMWISETIRQSLGATRYSGQTCYDTSISFANFCVKSGMQANNCSVASGENYLDALAASQFAADNNAPILLASKSNVKFASSFLKTNKASIDNVYVVSGPAWLGSTVVSAINTTLK